MSSTHICKSSLNTGMGCTHWHRQPSLDDATVPDDCLPRAPTDSVGSSAPVAMPPLPFPSIGVAVPLLTPTHVSIEHFASAQNNET